MRETQRRLTREFKEEAVLLALKSEKTVKEIALELGNRRVKSNPMDSFASKRAAS